MTTTDNAETIPTCEAEIDASGDGELTRCILPEGHSSWHFCGVYDTALSESYVIDWADSRTNH